MSNFFCSLCNVSLADENMLQIHLGTVQHQSMLRQQQHQPFAFHGGGGPSSGSARSLKQQQQQQQHQPMQLGPPGNGNNKWSCEMCDSKCTGEEMFQAHINGAKHKKKLREVEIELKKKAKDPDVYCQLCNLTLHPELMRAHLDGIRHLSALKAAGDPQAAELIKSKKSKAADIKTQQSVKRKGADSLAQMLPPDASGPLSKMPKQEVQKLVSKRLHMKCSVCDVPEFTTFGQAEQHYNSKAHRTVYQQHQQEQFKSKGKHCDLCKVTVSSDDLFDAHVQGYKHTLRANNGAIPPGHAFYDKFLKNQETMRNLKAGKTAAAAASAAFGSIGAAM